ncbi:hypothetical protein CQY20_30205 [Mycolicibacterium agri]|uniref:Uncharacterized protein n=1 Tax=Mycolicibacterium agri TaxID=36811 RepID=A0A2A7MP96_MYCAG|nr:hypothetical protein [Mycolicibacterium agri]PEG33555.1 hypothetical protein CQY20_30205 [Mycolicibacterium agri]GFG52961.1 hypothetical protein MAGR_44020 [Mycolicibacterium agri]
MDTTTYIADSEPTVRSTGLAYSQCLPEPDYGYPQHPQYAPYRHEQTPVQTPVKQSSSGKGLLFVAGLAVVGAAAFGGVYLMNSTESQPTATTSAAAATPPAGSTIINVPSAVEIPSLAPADDKEDKPTPVIVNNQAPVQVKAPAVAPKPVAAPAPKPIAAPAPKPIAAPPPAAAPAPAPAAAPAPAPAPATGPDVRIKAPFVDVAVPSQGGVSVKTPGTDIGVPGPGGQGGVSVSVPGSQTGANTQQAAERPAN